MSNNQIQQLPQQKEVHVESNSNQDNYPNTHVNYEEQYFKMMGRSQGDENSNFLIMQKLKQHNIKFTPDQFYQKINVTILHHTNNYQAIKLNVFYGKFNLHINIINVDIQNPIHTSSKYFVGNFGTVYQYQINNVSIAVKNIKIDKNNFQSKITEIIKEYFFLMIASALKVGPKLIKPFGFDIIAFRNECIFSMQFCQVNLDQNSSFVSISCLKEKLHLLHCLNIVHLDIKPQNIAFSPTFNSYVFIDFGLSRMIKQQIGTKTYTNFMGSFNFCSNEMLELYLSESNGFIDLYYNDAFCLCKSIKSFKGSTVKQFMQYFFKNYSQFSVINDYVVTLKTKFNLFQFSFGFIQKQPAILENQRSIINKRRFQFDNFIINLPKSFFFVTYYKHQLKKILKYDGQIKYTYDETVKKQHYYESYTPELFQERFESINKINANSKEQNLKQMQIKVYDRKSVQNMKLGLYKLALIKFICTNNIVEDLTQKISACSVFNQLCMKYEQKLSDATLYRKTIEHIFNSSLCNEEQESSRILLHSIEDVIVLEIIPQERLIHAYDSVLAFKIGFVPKMCLIFEFIASLEFIRQKFRTIYNYQRLTEIFMEKLNNFLDKVSPLINVKEQLQIFNKLTAIISLIPLFICQFFTIYYWLSWKQQQNNSYYLCQISQQIQTFLRTQKIYNLFAQQTYYSLGRLLEDYTSIKRGKMLCARIFKRLLNLIRINILDFRLNYQKNTIISSLSKLSFQYCNYSIKQNLLKILYEINFQQSVKNHKIILSTAQNRKIISQQQVKR